MMEVLQCDRDAAIAWEVGRGVDSAHVRLLAEAFARHRTFYAATPPADAWQPIETAPKDQRMMVWTPLFSGQAIGAKWNDRRFDKTPRPYWELDWTFAGVREQIKCPPTHWRPLPAPPEVS